MITITFTAKPTRKKPRYSTEDVNIYDVRYFPRLNGIEGTTCSDFSDLLLEAICGLPQHNPDKKCVRVKMNGDFPKKYVDETRRLLDFYSRAENVETQFNRY